MSKAVDIWIVYKIIKSLATPFDKMSAYKLGIIDANGKLLKSPSTREEKDAYTPFDRMIVNLKRIMSKANLDSKFATYAAAMFLIRESENEFSKEYTDKEIESILMDDQYTLQEQAPKTLRRFMEEMGAGAPANATGAAVVGTGDNQATWSNKRSKGRPKYQGKAINGVAFLRRMNKKATGG